MTKTQNQNAMPIKTGTDPPELNFVLNILLYIISLKNTISKSLSIESEL
jgi:hypothetical protein